MVYAVSDSRFLGDDATIVRFRDGYEEPVLHVIASDGRFTDHARKVADALAAVLSGVEPSAGIKLAMDGRMYWMRGKDGITSLRKYTAQGGVTTPSAMLIPVEREGAIANAVADAEFMGAFCSKIDLLKRAAASPSLSQNPKI